MHMDAKSSQPTDLQQAEIERLRLQRARYRTERDTAQNEVAALQEKLDGAQDQIADLKDALERALEAAGSVPRRTMKAVLTPPHSVIVEAPGTPKASVVGDDEVEYVGSSTSVGLSSKVQGVPKIAPAKPSQSPSLENPKRPSKMVPYVLIPPQTYSAKRDRASITETSNVSTNNVILSVKRQKVEGSAAQISTSTRNSAIESQNAHDRPVTSLPGVKLSKSSNSTDKPKTNSSLESGQKTFKITPTLVSGYLSTCTPFDIMPSVSPFSVSRPFLSYTYGGGCRQFIQITSPSLNPSGQIQRRILFPTYEFHPAMPTIPGGPGLLFTSRDEISENRDWSLFYKDPAVKKAAWTYAGEYEREVLGKMSVELFRSLQPGSKQAWGTTLIKNKRFDVYVSIRARIALRKAGIAQPTEEEEAEEMKRIRAHRGRHVTIEDMIAALESGQEAIQIVKMQCVGYDHTFARDMEAKVQTWNSPATLAQRQATRQGNAQKKGARRGGKGKKDNGKKKSTGSKKDLGIWRPWQRTVTPPTEPSPSPPLMHTSDGDYNMSGDDDMSDGDGSSSGGVEPPRRETRSSAQMLWQDDWEEAEGYVCEYDLAE